MGVVKKFYANLEEKVSSGMRVILVIAVTVVILVSLVMFIIGGLNSYKSVTLETQLNVLDYSSARDIIFNKQIQLVEEKEIASNEEEDKIPARIIKIHESINMHFTDLAPNRELFADQDKGLTPTILQKVIDHYASGAYSVGTFSSLKGVPIPVNNLDCIEGKYIPRLNEDQYDQMLNGLVKFWKEAEFGASDNSSKFNTIMRFNSRLGTVYVANDLFLCDFITSIDELDLINNQLESEVVQKNFEGMAMIASSGVLMDTMFKFFAAFAIVFLSLILIRIEKILRNKA